MTAEGVATTDDALRLLGSCDLLVCDLQLPGSAGGSLLPEVRRRRPTLPVIILTGHASVPTAVEAMRAGAANFLVKPVDLDDLEQAVRAALGPQGAPGPGGRVDPRVQARS